MEGVTSTKKIITLDSTADALEKIPNEDLLNNDFDQKESKERPNKIQNDDELSGFIPTTKKKRGLKPRSKRNRKRAKGGGVTVSNTNNNKGESNTEIKVEAEVVPLFFDKKDRMERLRVVKPYFFTFATFVKARWVGRTVLDVYASEFGSYPKVQ